jgi:radical SAM superfamily enzyme YgiQ (UPF0313 family)
MISPWMAKTKAKNHLHRKGCLMNILLISANTETINMPILPMGLGMVAAATVNAGHAVRFLDLMAESVPQVALADTLSEFCPDVIGISIRNVDDQVSGAPRFLLEQAREVVAVCKNLSAAPVVLGGAGYSMFPESALEFLGADMGIQGEGEAAFVSLLARLEAQTNICNVPGLYRRGKGCCTPRTYQKRLDDWPFPDPAIFSDSRFQDPSCYLPFQTRRGCPLRCSYCATAAIEGSRIRMRSPEAVVKELARWRAAGYNQIYFVDNTFNLPPDYAHDLCDQLADAELGISWRAIFYPGSTGETLIRAMARSGCTDVSMGFESGSDRVLSGMGKRFAVAEVRQTARMLKDAGISRMGFLLLGGPDETKDSVLESLRFADSLDLEAVKLTAGIRIYPYTRLAQIARSQGMISVDDDLLRPRFYIRRELESWLRSTLSQWAVERPNWRI